MSIFVKFRKNKRSNRNSLDIVWDMLIVALVSVRKTRIMHEANLSYFQVKKYLHDLLQQGLLKRDGDSCYLITNRGLRFIELYDEYVERCKWLKEQEEESVRDRMLLEQMCFNHDPDCNAKVTRKVLSAEN